MWLLFTNMISIVGVHSVHSKIIKIEFRLSRANICVWRLIQVECLLPIYLPVFQRTQDSFPIEFYFYCNYLPAQVVHWYSLPVSSDFSYTMQNSKPLALLELKNTRLTSCTPRLSRLSYDAISSHREYLTWGKNKLEHRQVVSQWVRYSIWRKQALLYLCKYKKRPTLELRR